MPKWLKLHKVLSFNRLRRTYVNYNRLLTEKIAKNYLKKNAVLYKAPVRFQFVRI